MTIRDLLMSASVVGTADKLYVDDVFSTYLYTGNGATQTINNGIDLAGKGGLVWGKCRNGTSTSHWIYDTARGAQTPMYANATGGQTTDSSTETGVFSFNNNGFTTKGASDYWNLLNNTYTSWTFCRAPKFFDVVTFTNPGTGSFSVNHSLSLIPGCIIIKRIDNTGSWWVYHQNMDSSSPGSFYALLNTASSRSSTVGLWITPTATSFTINTANGLSSAGTYVAYLFADDPSSDGLIQCGSYVGNGGTTVTNALSVNLGWEPQFILTKAVEATGGDMNWNIMDTMRGYGAENSTGNKKLSAQTSSAEESNDFYGCVTASGFKVWETNVNVSAKRYIYLAIRRPNKPPKTGADVFNATLRTTQLAVQTINSGFAPDTLFAKSRDGVWGVSWAFDKLRNPVSGILNTTSTATEDNSGTLFGSWNNTGITTVSNASSWSSSKPMVDYTFRRAPGFFDVVCYTGTGVSGSTVNHSLGVKPELFIIKSRNATKDWYVWSPLAGGFLNLTNSFAFYTFGNGKFDATSAYFKLSADSASDNAAGTNYVAYLFASLPGISKVGTYTGNGTSQSLDMGFTTGCRFFLCKRTDSTGDWYVWDSARGIVAANDPHLSLNSTAAEATADDSVDPLVSGITVNQVSATNINVSGATYIYLGIS